MPVQLQFGFAGRAVKVESFGKCFVQVFLGFQIQFGAYVSTLACYVALTFVEHAAYLR